MKNASLCYLAAALMVVGCGIASAQTRAAKNKNLSVSFEGNAEHCSDLKVRSSNGEIAQVNEAFALQKSEAPILDMSGMDRAIFQVRGWDRAEYSVEACKVAAAENKATAEQQVRGISIMRSAGRFSASGPSGDDANWQVYFIVRTPRDANLNLETKNGPISLSGVSGTVKVRATNAPVSLNDTSGNLDIHTANGPISLNGGGGEVRLTAQNAPISLNLAGEVWNGSKLDVETVNGPVSLNLADKFRSGVRLETSGHAPVSCRNSACASAWTDQHSEPRVMQLNGSQDTIRVSTTNGPVSVNSKVAGKRII